MWAFKMIISCAAILASHLDHITPFSFCFFSSLSLSVADLKCFFFWMGYTVTSKKLRRWWWTKPQNFLPTKLCGILYSIVMHDYEGYDYGLSRVIYIIVQSYLESKLWPAWQKGTYSHFSFLTLRAHNFLSKWSVPVHFAHQRPATHNRVFCKNF